MRGRDPREGEAPGAVGEAPGGLLRRLGWFALIWASSIAGLGVVAYAIRWVLR